MVRIVSQLHCVTLTLANPNRKPWTRTELAWCTSVSQSHCVTLALANPNRKPWTRTE